MKDKKHSMLKKYLKFFNIGLAAFLIIETGALIYIDKSFLHEDTKSITVQQVKNDVTSSNISYEVKLTGSEDDIKSSFDGKFLAYTVGKNLSITDITNQKKYDIKMDDNMVLNYFEWVYDRDQLIIAQKSKGGSYLKLYNLDAKQLKSGGVAEEIRDTVNNQKVRINLPASTYDVSDIDLSTSTVTTYLKLTNKYDKSRLWKFNLPDENRMYSNISIKTVGKIQCLKFQTELLYENTTSGTVNVAEKGSLKVDGTSKLQIIGFDGEDNVYLAKGNSKTTNEIYYGSLMKDNSSGNAKLTITPQMTSVKLDSSAKISDLHVSLKGDIYENNASQNTLTELKTGKKITYTGKLLSLYNKGFLTVNGETVKQNPFNAN